MSTGDGFDFRDGNNHWLRVSTLSKHMYYNYLYLAHKPTQNGAEHIIYLKTCSWYQIEISIHHL